MSLQELSASSQNYLKIIWSLQEWSDDPVTPTALAERAGVRLSTASDAIRKLAGQGLVDHTPYGSATLTDQGRTYAVAMVRRHRLIETFLVDSLGYTWDQVHDEAEALEHAVSDFLIDRIDETLGHPTRDPHGDPIPGPDGKMQMPDAVQLPKVQLPARVTVERISDDDPGLLRHFASLGIDVGSELEVEAGPPYSGALEVVLSGQRTSLGGQAPAAVWVTVH